MNKASYYTGWRCPKTGCQNPNFKTTKECSYCGEPKPCDYILHDEIVAGGGKCLKCERKSLPKGHDPLPQSHGVRSQKPTPEPKSIQPEPEPEPEPQPEPEPDPEPEPEPVVEQPEPEPEPQPEPEPDPEPEPEPVVEQPEPEPEPQPEPEPDPEPEPEPVVEQPEPEPEPNKLGLRLTVNGLSFDIGPTIKVDNLTIEAVQTTSD